MTALLFSVAIMALAFSVISSAVSLNNQKRYTVATDRAMEAAESGVHHLLGALKGSARKVIKDAGELDGLLQGDSDRAVRYEIDFANGASDNHDNDLDGQTDEADEKDIYEVRATGFADGVQYTIAVTLREEIEPVTAEVPGGIVWDNPDLGIELDDAGPEGGGSFKISGVDVDLDGNETGLVVPAVAVNGDPDTFKDKINEGTYENLIVGEGGNWSITNTSNTFDYQEWIDKARSEADVILDKDGGAIKGGSGPYGTADHPVIVWAKGEDPSNSDNHIKIGNATKLQGYGILVVDGSLEVQSDVTNFDWKGIVIVRSKLLVDSSWEMPFKIRGALVMHGSSGGPSKVDKDVTFDIQYSAEAINMAVGLAVVGSDSKWSIFHWREAPISLDGADS